MSTNKRPSKPFRAEPFGYHQELELTIDTLTNLGHGLGRVNSWVVMVPFALPGERIKARVFRNHKNYSEADLVEILDPSPHRVEPECDLFGICGGCQYQNLAYEKQLEWKRGQVAELLQHLARIPDAVVEPVISSPLAYGYRSKITPHFQKPRGEEAWPVGFLKVGRRFDLVDVPQCPIASGPINEALTTVRAGLREKAEGYKRGATLLLRESADGTVLTDSSAICRQQVGELTFEFPAGGFFQNNPSILPAFVNYVSSEAQNSGARFLVDAYCGSGLFALSCAGNFERVAGVEVSEGSVGFAKKNAAQNGITNAEFFLGDAETIFRKVDFAEPYATAVVIDPPRAGCSEAFLDQLFAYGPAAVVYVSCNPATQMRDLIRFREAGYELKRVQPFDLFPQTRHLECVITLGKS